jgi:DNA adenine methylase
MEHHPIVPWLGGKRRLAKSILPLFPRHACYVEPFAGAAALFFLKEPSETEVLNDINGELVNLYRVVRHHLEELVRQFKWAMVSREMFKWLQATPIDTLTDVQRAARFYFLQKCAFGARLVGSTFGTATKGSPRLNLLRIEEELSQAHLRLARTFIERLPWADCVGRYDRPHTLFYMDPPYWGTEGYGVPFELGQYDAMAEAMRQMKGRAIVSVNDIPAMRAAFKGFPTQRLEIRYQVGGRDQPRKVTGELLIRSWK